MIRPLLMICSVLLVGTLAANSLTSQTSKADFTFVNPSGIHTLDPARMSWLPDFRLAINLWEGLTTWNPTTGTVAEGVASFPPEVSDDGLTYRFHIRDDARWSNGDPVTTADFIRAWRRGLEPGTSSDYAFLFTDLIVGAKDYVHWREKAVAALAPLSRLREGWEINAQQATRLSRELGDRLLSPQYRARSREVRDDGYTSLDEASSTAEMRYLERERDRSVSNEAPPARTQSNGADLAAQINDMDVDWAALHEDLFHEHVAQLDVRWGRVGFIAVDERNLLVRLVAPCPYFPDLTAYPIFMPCHSSIERLRRRYHGAPITAEGLVVYDPQWTKPEYRRNGYRGLTTNGPYRLTDWTFKRRARMTVNPYYRDAEMIPCAIVDMLVYENASAAIMAYEAGQVDFLPSMTVDYDHEIARLARTGARPDFHLCHALATFFINFNCVSERVGDRVNPFVDRRVRRAFALAIDKRGLVEEVLNRGDRVASTFVPRGAIPGYVSPAGLRYDSEAARRLLAEAGYPDGAGLPPIPFLVTSRDSRLGQALARTWEQVLGAGIELKSQESKTYAENVANHRFMIARGNWYADYNDPTTFLNCLATGNGNNDSGYSNRHYDHLLDAARATNNVGQRAAFLKEAETLIVEVDLPIVPLFHYADPVAIKPYIRGLYPNARLWFPFRNVTVTR